MSHDIEGLQRPKRRRIPKPATPRKRTYSTWRDMMRRCFEKTHMNYSGYGGRGITVCDRWMTFNNFLADMGYRERGMTLERIENGGDYSPSNCRWATRKEQNLNTSTTKLITFNGETRCQNDWERHFGLSRGMLSYRLTKKKQTLEQAMRGLLR